MNYIAILGLGTVGGGVYELLKDNCRIKKMCGDEITVAHIFDNRDIPEVSSLLTNDFNKILTDKKVRVVAETMGGVSAYDYVAALLDAGKSVVTSNKDLVAEKGAELFEIALKRKVNFLFEASVGGGIPILRPIFTSFASDRIISVAGILNGTTNFILSEMAAGLSFNDALALAQDRGYAEADPSSDILGLDAARKLSILISLITDKFFDYKHIQTEGITAVQKADANTTKLIARATFKSVIEASVRPEILDSAHPLSLINGCNNALLVECERAGTYMLMGPGAGSMPTAQAVISDIIECLRDTSYSWGR